MTWSSPAEQIVSGDARIVAERLVERAAVGVALQRESVRGGPPVGAKADLPLAPAVARRRAVGFGGVEDVERPAVDAIRSVRPERSAVARAVAALEVAASRVRVPALGIRGSPRDHVDHAVDGVRAPQCRPRTADHLDALDVLEHDVLGIPEHAGEKRRVHRAPVDQDQELVVDRIVEAARADGVRARAGTRDLEVGREPQGLGKAGRTRAADVLRGDHEYGGGGVREPLRALGDRSDLDVAQLFDAEVREIGHLLWFRGERCRSRRGKQGVQDQCAPSAHASQHRASA